MAAMSLSAKLDKIAEHGGDGLDEDDRTLLRVMADRQRRIEACGTFSATAVISAVNGRGRVDVTIGDGLVQFTAERALEAGTILFEAAMVAKMEAALAQFLKARAGMTEAVAAQFVADLRDFNSVGGDVRMMEPQGRPS